MPATTEEFRRQLEAWAKYHEFHATFYDTEQWKRHSPGLCDFALVSMTCEDPLMTQSYREDALWEFCRKWEWEYERGYHYSWHFWPEGYADPIITDYGEVSTFKFVKTPDDGMPF